jgi:chorismate dehydratase
MTAPEQTPKLRMAPPETPEELARRFERETRPALLQRESQLEDSLAGFKVGSVPYLNAVPLTRGLEEQILFAPPAELARLLRRDELDAALVSLTEVLLHDRYDILDGIAVASLGEVKSVFLAHRPPLAEAREIYCDTASLSSLNLLKVLLAEKGLKPELRPLPDYRSALSLENVLLIGDQALEFARSSPPHELWDLGAAWFDLTGLPFVYAVWALRRVPNEALRRRLREARNFGLDTLDYIISSRTDF